MEAEEEEENASGDEVDMEGGDEEKQEEENKDSEDSTEEEDSDEDGMGEDNINGGVDAAFAEDVRRALGASAAVNSDGEVWSEWLEQDLVGGRSEMF